MPQSANPVLQNIVSMELSGMMEEWRFAEDAVHILLSQPVSSCCGAPHWWFVNREGRTRCIDCDQAFVILRAQAWRANRRPAVSVMEAGAEQ